MKKEQAVLFWLHEITLDQTDISGHELSQLGQLAASGFAIPFGFVVSSLVWQTYIRQTKLDAFISQQLENTDLTNSRQRAVAARVIQEKIKTTPLPSSLIKIITSTYTLLMTHSKETVSALQVRPYLLWDETSTKHTPLPEVSIATPAALIKAIHSYFSQQFSAEHLYQLSAHKGNTEIGDIALLVQVAHEAEKSGTVSLEQDTLSIEAVWGSNPDHTQKGLTPDRYLLDRVKQTIFQRDINKQTWKLNSLGTSSRHISVSRLDQSAQKVGDAELFALQSLTQNLTRQVPSITRFSWKCDSTGRLWVNRILTHDPSFATQPLSSEGENLAAIGKGLSGGVATGPVRFISNPKELKSLKIGDILVAELPDPLHGASFDKIAGLIIESARPSDPLIVQAQEMGIPTIIGVTQASHHLKQGLLVTMNGHTGEIYRGSVPHEDTCHSCTQGSTQTIITGSKIYADIDDLEQLEQDVDGSVDGLILNLSHQLWEQFGSHPKSLTDRQLSTIISSEFSQNLRNIAEALSPAPAIYLLNDKPVDYFHSLPGGENHETLEPNSMSGYRGAIRHLKELDTTRIELEAIRKIRFEYNLTNLHLGLSYVRTFQEYNSLRNIISSTGLLGDPQFRLWLNCQVPATLFQLEKFCKDGNLGGVILDLHSLSQHLLAIDHSNPRLINEYCLHDDGILQMVKQVTDVCRQYNIPVIAQDSQLSLHPELMNSLLCAGVTGLSTQFTEVGVTRGLVASVEQHIILENAVAALHQND